MFPLSDKLIVKNKIWIEDKKGNHVFGLGLMTLLNKIHKFGSLQKAANDLHMSYRAAWGKIKTAEKHLGTNLLDRHIGGQSGGGSDLTPNARKLMEQFNQLVKHSEASTHNFFKDLFLGDQDQT